MYILCTSVLMDLLYENRIVALWKLTNGLKTSRKCLIIITLKQQNILKINNYISYEVIFNITIKSDQLLKNIRHKNSKCTHFFHIFIPENISSHLIVLTVTHIYKYRSFV